MMKFPVTNIWAIAVFAYSDNFVITSSPTKVEVP